MNTRARAPLITVGVPVYNGEKYLATTLDSLLHQTFDNFIILIGDNASTDATETISRNYVKRDSRIRYVRHPGNLGAANNYNRVFELADSRYFRWCAVDDPSQPRYLEACLEVVENYQSPVLAYPRVMLIDAKGDPIQEYDEGLHLTQDRPSDRFLGFLKNTRLCNALYGLVRTDVLKRTRLMGNYIGSDIVFQAELALYAKFVEIPEVLLLRRMHKESSSSMTDEELLEFYFPGRKPGAPTYHWRHLAEHVKSVLRAPLPVAERLRIFAGLGRRAVWNRSVLWNEIRVGSHLLMRGSSN